MRTGSNTSMAAAPGTDFSGLANLMAMKGRGGDNTLVHMSKAELPYLNMLAKSAGYPQGLPVNPETGLPEANILKTILPVAGAILGGMFFPPSLLGLGAGSALATGVGAGLGSFGGSLLSGRSLKDAAIGGLISGGLAGVGSAAFGGQSFMGDQLAANPATAGAAGPDIVGPQLAAVQGTGPSTFVAQGMPELGSFDAMPLQHEVMSFSAGNAFRLPSGTPFETTFIPTELGPTTANISEFVAANPAHISGPPIGVNPAAFTDPSLTSIPGTYGTGAATPSANLVTAATPVPADAVAANMPTGLELKEGVTELSRASARNIMNLPKEAGFTDLGVLTKFDPKTMNALDFAKYAAKPMTTAGAAGIGLDAVLEQGAFEPIDYSSFPQAGEERRVSPFDTSGIRFASRRTGAFPRTEEEALAFAQPGGTRQRFFDQGFFTSAKTGGGLADLEVQRFFGGGETGGDDTGPGDADDPGDSGSSVGGDASDDGFDSGSVGPDDMGDFGAVADAAVAAAIAEANEAAAIADQAMSGPPIGTNPAAFRGSTEDDIEDDLFDVEMGLPSPPTIPADTMDDFGNLSRADIANILDGSFVNPGLSIFGFQTDIGRGPFGGYTSTDQQTQQADIDQGFDTAPVGSFSPFGFASDVGKTALSVALPGSGLALTAAQQAGKPSGTGALGALSNVLGDEEEEGATTKAKGGLLKMAQGGDTKDVLSFLSPAYGLGRAAKKGGMKGALSFLSPAFALSQGELPGPFNNLMSAQSGKVEQQAPAVRDAEAPTEQIALPPTKEELEEARDVAVLQQVLSGVPVEAQAGGLISAYQMGGPPSPYFEGMVKGRGDGMSDSIPFTIEGTQPAILSRDEYVLPADIVSMMGNGSSDAGAEKIDTFINDFRVQKYGRGKQPPETRRGLSGVA